ncbi:MAG: hypothetical protein R3C16_08200 [Hyphomonadaceae bacterium]
MTSVAEPDTGVAGPETGLAALIDALPTAVYTTDVRGYLTSFNRVAAELAGRTPILGKDRWCVSYRIYHPDGTLMDPETCPLAETLRTGAPVRGKAILAERPDGARVPLMPFPTPLFDEIGRLTGAVNLLVDISALTDAETKAARRADRASRVVPLHRSALSRRVERRNLRRRARRHRPWHALFARFDPSIRRRGRDALRRFARSLRRLSRSRDRAHAMVSR